MIQVILKLCPKVSGLYSLVVFFGFLFVFICFRSCHGFIFLHSLLFLPIFQPFSINSLELVDNIRTNKQTEEKGTRREKKTRTTFLLFKRIKKKLKKSCRKVLKARLNFFNFSFKNCGVE